MADEQTNDAKVLSAPYTAFSSIRTALKQMKEHGIPNRIDRSVLTNFSGAVSSQVMTALKFLGLTDSEGRPREALAPLVAACEDEKSWPGALSPVIRSAYAPMFEQDLEKLSPSQFNELFKRSYPGADAVLRKSMTFFLNAAREAGIPISAYILKNKKPRTASGKRKLPTQKARSNGNRGEVDPPPPPPAPPAPSSTLNKPMEYMLLDLLSPSMTDEQRQAVWTLISFVKQPKGAA